MLENQILLFRPLDKGNVIFKYENSPLRLV